MPWKRRAAGIVISYGDKRLPVSVEFLNASQHGLVQPQDPRVTWAGLKAQGRLEGFGLGADPAYHPATGDSARDLVIGWGSTFDRRL